MGFFQPYSGLYSGVSPTRYTHAGVLNVGRQQLTEDVAPEAEPITLAEAKAHLRVDFSDDDTLIQTLIGTAREYVEKLANRALVERTSTAKIMSFADVIRLPFRPITALVSIKYYNIDSPSVLTTLFDSASPGTPSDVFMLDTDYGALVRNDGQVYPAHAIRTDAVQIQFTHGLAPDTTQSPISYSANVPAPLRHAMLLFLGDLYENREISTPLTMQELPAFERIIKMYRFRR